MTEALQPAPVQEKVTPSVPQQQATTTTNQKVIVNVSALNIRQGASFFISSRWNCNTRSRVCYFKRSKRLS